MELIKAIFPWGPVLFGIGFLARLIAAFLTSVGISAPLGLTEMQTGLIVGGTWGLVAKFGGRWI